MPEFDYPFNCNHKDFKAYEKYYSIKILKILEHHNPLSDKHISMEKRAEQYAYFIWCSVWKGPAFDFVLCCFAPSIVSQLHESSSSLKYSFIEYFNKPEKFSSRFPFRLCINTLGKWEKFFMFSVGKKMNWQQPAFHNPHNSSSLILRTG